MFILFSHAGHYHPNAEAETIELSQVVPLLTAAIVIILILIAVIVYMLVKWQPKKVANTTKTTAAKK
jgi:heme/copper-type cytochrome/quinol oxidase subunit 2